MKSLKLISLSTAAVLSFSMLTGFGAVSPKDTSAQPVTIKVAKWGDSSQQSSDPDYKLMNSWNKTHPNLQIKLDIIPGDGYGTKLTTSFASGDGYDVFESGEGDFYKWVSQGVNQPLTSFISSDKSFKPSSFSQSIYKMGNINSKQYYLIKDYNPLVLYYSKKMFANAKIAAPNDKTTWNTIFQVAKKLTKKDSTGKYKAYGFDAGSWTYSMYAYLQSNGADVANAAGTKVNGYLNSKATVSALEKWFALSKDGAGKASPNAASLSSYGGDEKMLANNMLGMFISGYWSSSTLASNNADYGTALIPIGSNGKRASILCAAGYTMSNKTKNAKDAWQIIKYLTGESAQKVREQTPGVLPTTQSLLNQKIKSINKRDLAVINILPYCKQPVGLRSKLGSTIDTDFGTALQQIVQGTGSVQTIMDNAVKQIEAGNK